MADSMAQRLAHSKEMPVSGLSAPIARILKREAQMSSPISDGSGRKGRGLSLDEWAVVTALLLSLLVRIGIITRVPW